MEGKSGCLKELLSSSTLISQPNSPPADPPQIEAWSSSPVNNQDLLYSSVILIIHLCEQRHCFFLCHFPSLPHWYFSLGGWRSDIAGQRLAALTSSNTTHHSWTSSNGPSSSWSTCRINTTSFAARVSFSNWLSAQRSEEQRICLRHSSVCEMISRLICEFHDLAISVIFRVGVELPCLSYKWPSHTSGTH